MEREILKGLNTTSVIASIILPVVFAIGSAFEVIMRFGDSFGDLVFMLVYFLLTTIGFWGNVIQGLRSISNGKRGTIISSSVFQLIMFISYIVAAGRISYIIRNSSIESTRKFMGAFIVIFLVMSILAVVKIAIAAKTSDKGTVVAGSKRISRKILLYVIVLPTAFVGISVGIVRFLDANPGVAKAIGVIAAIVLCVIAIAVFMFVLSLLEKAGLLGSEPTGEVDSASAFDKAAYEAEKADKNRDARKKLLEDRIKANRKGIKGKQEKSWNYAHYDVDVANRQIEKDMKELKRLADEADE